MEKTRIAGAAISEGDEKPIFFKSFDARADFKVKEIRLTFDSNLSREITPSIDENVLGRQEFHSPSELIKEYELELKLDGETVQTLRKNSEGQRLQVIHFPESCMCDEIAIKVLSTCKSPKACIYEVRVYE